MIESWDKVLSRESAPGAIYVRWTATEAARQREAAVVRACRRRVAEAIGAAVVAG